VAEESAAAGAAMSGCMDCGGRVSKRTVVRCRTCFAMTQARRLARRRMRHAQVQLIAAKRARALLRRLNGSMVMGGRHGST